MTFLLDTNIVSELVRPAPDPKVAQWVASHAEVAVSVISVDEIYFGLTRRPSARVQRLLEVYLDTYCRALEVTTAVPKHAGILRGQLARRGVVRTQADMLIAATASAHGLTLATRNVGDFDVCGIAVHGPFA